MKVNAELDGETFEVDIERVDGRLVASVNGRRYELGASQPEPHVHLLKFGDRVFELIVSPPSNSDGVRIVSGKAGEFEIRVYDPRKLRGASGGTIAADGVAEIRTAMPGKLVRVLAPEGTEVVEGDGIVVVEAMKMQNEMRSPKAGKVTEVRFAEGANVNAGDVLAIVE